MGKIKVYTYTHIIMKESFYRITSYKSKLTVKLTTTLNTMSILFFSVILTL